MRKSKTLATVLVSVGAVLAAFGLGFVADASALPRDDGLEAARRKCCLENGGKFSEVGGGCGGLGAIGRLPAYKQCVAKANGGTYKQPVVPPGYMKDPNHPGRVIPKS